MKPEPVRDFVITPHAAFEMARRGLDDDAIRAVLSAPEQGAEVQPGRVVLQSRMVRGTPRRAYLVRVVVDVDRQPAEVVTAYRTSKVSKYWRDE